MLAPRPGKHHNGRFPKGWHWRPAKAHWERAWLDREYTERGRSAADIATEMGCIENNILYWLKKHGIPRRSMSEVRERKHWGVVGAKNPMFGRRGVLNHNFKGGATPERQREYARSEWRQFVRSIYERDQFRCLRCGSGHSKDSRLHAHHLASFSLFPELRHAPSNLVTLCGPCHRWVHSNQNKERAFLK